DGNSDDEDYEDFRVEVLRGKTARNGPSRSTSRGLRIAGIQDRTVEYGDSVSFFIPVSNTPKDAKVRFRIVGDAPEGAEVDPETGMFSWRPESTVSPGEYKISVAAEANGRASAKRDFSITVKKPDGLASWPPRVRDIADQTAAPGETVRLRVRARDWNRPPQERKYDLDFPPEGATIDAETGEFVWTPGDVYAGRSVPITVRVTQVEARRSTTREFKVHVTSEPSGNPDLPPASTVDEDGIRTLTGLGGTADGVAISESGDRVAAGSVEGKLCVWSAETGKLLQEFDVRPGALNSVVFSLDGTLVAAGGDDKTVRIWEIATGEKRQELTGLSGAIRTIQFAPGNQYVAAASSSAKDVLLWQVAEGELQRTFKPGTDRANDFVLCIAFRPDAGRLAAGRLSKTISIWDSRTGREDRSIESGLVSALAYRTDNRLLVTADLSRKLVFREIGTSEEPIEKTLDDRPTALTFSRDGQSLAVLLSTAGLAPSTKKVQIWNVDQQSAESTLDDAGMRVRDLTFGDDNRSVALVGTKDEDVLVRTWKPSDE
ncbi:MAG: putative Ig domain-containing protein, partial [Pirellulales bacterium]|nr:putative Ig domain-containing protein [Pirellulales bacterium]